MQLDDRQSIAAGSLDRSMIVTAGAGSGKTRVLVERYLKLITRETKGVFAGPERVVAITFTEKAASEMRIRVERSLRQLIMDDKGTDRSASLKCIMERLPQARISTIDSFCMNLIRKYPLHAGVHPEFSVIEPGDAKQLKYDSLKEALATVTGTLGVSERDELGRSITEACKNPSNFIKVMEARMNSKFTWGAEPYDGGASGVGLILTRIRDKAISLYIERLGRLKSLDFALMEDRAVKLLACEMGDEIRSGIDYLLVDEYQDINVIQDRLIRGLILPEGSTMEEIIATGKLFMVGDLKQSIYRFRVAEPKIFEAWIEKGKSTGNYVNLENNYRSNPVLVEFNNRLFSKLLGGTFEESKAGRLCFDENGCALVHVLASPKNEKGLLYDKTAEKVLEILKNSKCRDSEGAPRKLSYRDIAILTPTNSGIDPYAEALERCGIPAVIYKSGEFYQSDTVAFVISLLSVALNDSDDIAAYQLLASPAYRVREATLASLCIYTNSLSSCLYSENDDLRAHFFDDGEYGDFLRARDAVIKCRATRNSHSTREMLELLCEENDLEKDVISGYGRRGIANFRKLIELSSNAALSLGNAADFLRHLRTYRENGIQVDEPNILDDDEDAVRLMTIHKAKGLEFPVVILGQGNVDMEGKIDNDESEIVQLEDGSLLPKVSEDHPLYPEYSSRVSNLQRLSDQERQRLMYVASTRAEELLVISGSEASKQTGKEGTKVPRKQKYFFGKLEEAMETAGICDVLWRDDMTLNNLTAMKEEPAEPDPVHDSRFVERMLARSNDQIVRFSPSSLMSYISCPKAYLRRHWFRLPESDLPSSGTGGRENGGYNASDLGTIVHFIAQRVERPQDLEEALAYAKEAFRGQLEGNPELMSRVESLSSNYCEFLASNASGGEVKKEVEFCLKVGEFFLEGIIDRLEGIGNNSWIITDLKTNNIEKQSKEMLGKKYEIQLLSYILAAAKVLGSTNVKARLAFLVDNTFVEQPMTDILTIEEKLYGLMSQASRLPEKCKCLDDACQYCEKTGECQEIDIEDAEPEVARDETDDLSSEV